LAAAAVAVPVGVAAVVAPLFTLVGVLAVLFVAISARSLAAGVALFTVLVFFTRIPALGGEDVTYVRLAGGVLAVLWFIRLANRDAQTPFLARDHQVVGYAAIAFVVWSGASTLWAVDVGAALNNSFQFVQALVLLFVVYTAIQKHSHLWWVVAAFVGGAALSAFTGLIGFTSPERYPLNPQRLTGGIRDANELAAILVPALALAIFGFLAVRSKAARVAFAVACAVTAFALLRTESRGGLVALVVMFLAALVFAGPARARVTAILSGTIVFGVVYYAVFAPSEAVARVTNFSEGGGSGRTDIWAVAVEIWRSNPIFGVGAGNFRIVEPSYVLRDVALERLDLLVDRALVAHNTYLQIASELGLVGFGLFAILILSSLVVAARSFARFQRAGQGEMELLARGVFIGTIGMLTAFFFISGQNLKQLPLLLGTLVALSSLAFSLSIAGAKSLSAVRTPPMT
jgi:O-antigen ligase